MSSPLVFTSCFSTKYLKNDENFLYKQRIKGTQEVSKDELSTFYQQKPNRRFPLVPSLYVWFYQTGSKNFDEQKYRSKIDNINSKYDVKIARAGGKVKKEGKINRRRNKKIRKVEKTLREGNLLMRWGEPVVTLDSSSIIRTEEQFMTYLHSKGYFRARTDYSVLIKNRKARVDFNIAEGQPFILDTLVSSISDPKISSLLSAFQEEEGLLRKGDNFDQDILSQERRRIEKLLRDNGYFDFSRRFVDFEVDTTLGDQRVGIRTIIRNPGDDSKHRIFEVDSIVFTTDAKVGNPNRRREHFIYNGITYNYFNDLYSFKVLDRRIFIHPGELYSKQKTFETQQQLTNMNVFRFVNVNYDSTGGRFVANVFASPRRRQQFTSELGVTITYGYPGPFFDLGYVIRNIFHGLENLQFNLRVGVEGVPSATDFTNILATTELGLSASLIFPQFLIPGSSALKNRYGEYNPKSIVTGGYSLIDRPEYNRKSVEASLVYSWSNEKKRTYAFHLADVRFINTTFKDSAFFARLEELERQGNNLINSFLPSFVTDSRFTAAYNFGDYGLRTSEGSFFRWGIESGGTLLNLFGTDFLTQRGLEYYKYIKGEVDFRKRIKLSTSTVLAYRATAGLAMPYSDLQLLPYERYFFAGGAVSVRAWRPRRLGPGSFTPTDANGIVTYDIEQPGEVLFDAGIELRQDFSKILEGALFVDAGNIWVIRDTDTRKDLGGGIDGFAEEIAMGAGVGLRLDFTYFLFRIDAAFKIYDPARLKGNRFILSDGFFKDPVNDAESNEFPLINFAIGYPF